MDNSAIIWYIYRNNLKIENMLKYVETMVTFSEVPDEATLCVNISNCQNHCKGCHSPHLLKNIGSLLDFRAIDGLISKNDGITCFCFMGEGNGLTDILHLAGYIKNEYGLKVALYSGREDVPEDSVWHILDYIKIGPYKEEFGPLNKKTTNQRLYKHVADNEKYAIVNGKKREKWEDVTYKFWK